MPKSKHPQDNPHVATANTVAPVIPSVESPVVPSVPTITLPVAATVDPNVPNAQPAKPKRVPKFGSVSGDMDRVFDAAREQLKHQAKREDGDENDIAQIKATYEANKLGLPIRIVQTYDWPNGFRYIVVTGKRAAHVAYLTPDSKVVSVRAIFDAKGAPQGLEFLYRE